MIKAINDTCQVIGSKSLQLAFFVSFVLTTNAEDMTAEKVYLALALLGATKKHLLGDLPLCILYTTQLYSSLKRIQVCKSRGVSRFFGRLGVGGLRFNLCHFS